MPFVDARELTVQQLLAPQEIYHVPLYQRNYEWGKEQWQDLFDDITNAMEERTHHFLGSIVVVPEGEHRKGINRFQIVDGQQRFATIMIMLSAARAILEQNANREFADMIRERLYEDDWHSTIPRKHPRMVLGKLDAEAFEQVLQGKPGDSKHLVFQCYQFFKDRLLGFDVAKVKAFVLTLLREVSVVHINAFSLFNAFRLFETLNDRGLELSATDLLKNFLLMRVSDDDEVVRRVIEEWNEMYSKVQDREPVKFVRKFLMSRYDGVVSEPRLYEQVSERIKSERWNGVVVQDFVESLNASATIYRNITSANLEPASIGAKMRDLLAIEVAPSYTLLLNIFPLLEKGMLDTGDVLRILNAVETFHVRWGVCAQATNRLDQIYSGASAKVRKASNRDGIMKAVMEALAADTYQISDNDFLHSFSMSNFRPSESRTKYILWRLSRPTGETILNQDDVQVEHIMPLTLSSEWIEALRSNTGFDESEVRKRHAEYVNRIGNLTLIKGKWNRKLSNKTFSYKRTLYSDSDLKITSRLADLSSWGFDEIDERSALLSRQALEIWTL